jgi:hypothetical protein
MESVLTSTLTSTFRGGLTYQSRTYQLRLTKVGLPNKFERFKFVSGPTSYSSIVNPESLFHLVYYTLVSYWVLVVQAYLPVVRVKLKSS